VSPSADAAGYMRQRHACPIPMARYKRRCGRPIAGTARVMCVHEHLWEGELCAAHLSGKPSMICPWCERAPGEESHKCRMFPEGVPGAVG
jgi:hypothetical protein